MIRSTYSTSGYRANSRRGLAGDTGVFRTRNQVYRQVRAGLGLSAG